MATKFGQKKPKLHKFQFLAINLEFFSHVNTGLLNSNMLPAFSTEPRELPWQPKLCKNKPKFDRFEFR